MNRSRYITLCILYFGRNLNLCPPKLRVDEVGCSAASHPSISSQPTNQLQCCYLLVLPTTGTPQPPPRACHPLSLSRAHHIWFLPHCQADEQLRGQLQVIDQVICSTCPFCECHQGKVERAILPQHHRSSAV